VLLAGVIFGCTSPPPGELPSRWYRAVVATGVDDEIPFFVELPANCNTGVATIANGTERI
jgi:hypothetical protein